MVEIGTGVSGDAMNTQSEKNIIYHWWFIFHIHELHGSWTEMYQMDKYGNNLNVLNGFLTFWRRWGLERFKWL